MTQGVLPSVSVIIPTYNRASLVDRCLTSLHASGISGLEVIVVDDGGTDDTEAVVRGRGTYLRQANAGPAKARNVGFESSRGRYVAFIDSDDEWIGQAASRLVDRMDANPDVDVLFADSAMGSDEDGYVSFVDEYGAPGFAELPHESRAGGVRVFDRGPFFRQLSTRNVMFLGSMLIRRAFFERVGRFDPALRGAADWDFFMRAAAQGVVAFSEGPPVSRYYKHGEGMSTDQDHMVHDFILALDSVARRAPLDPAARRHVRARMRAMTFGWAWRAWTSGDVIRTRERLRIAARLGTFGMREAVYLVGTYLPRGVVRAIRGGRAATGA